MFCNILIALIFGSLLLLLNYFKYRILIEYIFLTTVNNVFLLMLSFNIFMYYNC